MLSDIKLFIFYLKFYIFSYLSSRVVIIREGTPLLCDFKGRVTLYLFALEPLLQGKPIISQFVY